AALLGFLVHRRSQAISPQVVRWMGPGMMTGAAVGGVASKYATLTVLEAAFVVLPLAAAPLLFFRPLARAAGQGPPREFPRTLALGAAVSIGLLSGLVGVGGAFLTIPVMIYFLGVPTRIPSAARWGWC